MNKVLYITNIPTPYRQKRFNTMSKIFPLYGLDLEVIYMAKSEPNRNWIVDKNSFNYNYEIFSGIHPTIGDIFAHFNPGLLLRLLKNDYKIAIIGGMASPSHVLSSFFISSKKIKIMSVESNLFSVGSKKGIFAILKKILLKRSDVYQVTGTPQIEYIKFFNKNFNKKKIIRLPNLIDESKYLIKVKKLRKESIKLRKEFGLSDKIQMWVLTAIITKIKGVIPFIKLLKKINNIKLFILGDGEQYESINKIIKINNLPVISVGFVQIEDVLKYYSCADLFVLPSLRDPSPLSPIEAIAAGLPLLVSSRIGNLDDVLDQDINGWCYDPVNEIEKAKKIITKISKYSRKDLRIMGQKSISIYKNNFDTEMCLNKYGSDLKKLLEPNKI